MVKFFMEATATTVKHFKDIVFFKCYPIQVFLDIQKKIVQSKKFDPDQMSDIIESFYYSSEKIWRGLCLDWNFLEKPANDSYVWATIISNDDLAIYRNAFHIKKAERPDTAIFFIGGGGFIASTESLQETFLRDYCKNLNCIVYEFHYKLAPEFKYPFQLHEMLETYLGLVFYYKHYLGITLKKIILMGDSAGGNLVMGLTNLLILLKQRVPDLLMLVYPAANLDERRFTPSLLNSFNERLLYFTILEKCLTHYIDDAFDPQKDWLLSPGLTPDEILSKYPRTEVFCGEFDPLFDDSYKLCYRLNGLKIICNLHVFEHLYHGFLSFDLPFGQGMSEVSKIHDLIKNTIRDFIK
jgi:hormone-sensitive lipase